MKKNIFKFGAALTAAMMVFSATAMLAYADTDETVAEPETVVSDVVTDSVEDAEPQETEAPAEDAEEAPADNVQEVVIPLEMEESTVENIEAAAEIEAAAQVDDNGSVIEIGTISAAKSTDYYTVTVPFTVENAPSQMSFFVYDITALASGAPSTSVGYQTTTPVGYIDQAAGAAKKAEGKWVFKLSAESYSDDSIIVVKMGGTDVATPDAASVKLGDAQQGGSDVTLGDVNGDGTIDMADAGLVMQFYLEKTTFTDDQKSAANVDTVSSEINMADAGKIMQYYLEKITSFE